MKTKIFTECDEPRDKKGYCEVSLEKRINDFIKGKKVVDIKYQSSIIFYASDYVKGFKTIERALVMYEDKQDLSSYKFIDVIDN